MSEIIFLVYIILGYWAAGETIYANKIRIGTWSSLFVTRCAVGAFAGIIIIPIAIIKKLARG